MKRNFLTIRRMLPILVFTIMTLALFIYSPSGAIGDNRAAVIVDFGNGQVAARCVSFAEESISGYEALLRTGLPVEVDFQSGGAAVCQIGGQGCPSDDCFCSCPGGGNCIYWSYWHQNDGIWSYSAAGSALYRLRDGAVDGWVWGYGSVTQAQPPPAIPFNEVCVDEPTKTPTATVAPSLTPTQIVLPTAAPLQTAQPVPPTATAVSAVFTVTPLATSPPSQSVQATATTSALPTSAATQPVGTPSSGGTLPTGQENRPSPTAPTSGIVVGQVETAQPLDPSSGASELVAEPESSEIETGGGTIAAEAIITIPDANQPAEGYAAPGGDLSDERATPTPVVIVAVIGADAVTNDVETVLTTRNEQSDEGWRPYIGFVGLVAFLGALALMVYYRRGGMMDKGR